MSNRVIKFRVWDKTNKKWVNDQGYNDYCLSLSGKIMDNSSYDGAIEVHFNRGKNLEIMQYTGLLDRNGKEIYESDIVSFMEDLSNPQEVYYKDGAFWPLVTFNTSTAITVLGNIYESPDLLSPKEEKV